MLMQMAKVDKAHALFPFHASKGFVRCVDYKTRTR